MGFNLIEETKHINITIDTLTEEMIMHLINFYACNIEPIDVQMNDRIFERTGIVMDYPRISKEVVELFYRQLDALKQTVIDITRGKYHSTNFVIDEIPDGSGNYFKIFQGERTIASNAEIQLWNNSWGTIPQSIESLKTTTYTIIKRDFFEIGSWIYVFAEGDFDQIKPFIDNVILLLVAATLEVPVGTGNFNLFVSKIQSRFPFEESDKLIINFPV